MHAIILAGGLGTRLRPLIADRPKVMAPVAGHPFLHFLLTALARQGCADVVLCVGYRAEQIEAHFGSGHELGMHLRYSVEHEPLGTAGALKLAEPLLDFDEYLVLNGDSYLGAPYGPLLAALPDREASGVLALHRVDDVGRYGSVAVAPSGQVTSFVEKGAAHERHGNLVNAGVYALRRAVIAGIVAGQPQSLEHDVLPGLARAGALYGVELDGAFIDIGVPEDYRRLERDWRALLGSEVAE